MAKSGSMPNYKTIDDYIAAQPENAQIILKELRKIIKDAIPEVIEIQNYKVPSFTLVAGSKPEQQLMIVAYSKYVSFYPFQATVDHFVNELERFEMGKGTVKFPFNQPLPKELIKEMVIFRRDELINH
ncbi:MAG: hypothetical protein H6Q25_1649 [Bacteroidetes bacterium]|nr:hypothetical protein [Bacteroidota bacterium]